MLTNWLQLDTKEIRNDTLHTYYEARTTGFSHFVVTGLKEEVISTPEPEVTATGKPEITPTPLPDIPRKVNFAWIIYLLITLVILSGLYFFIWGRRRDGEQ